MSIIEDGKGSGKKAGVSITNRLETQSVTRSEENHHLHRGESFNVETPIFTLTSANESAIMHLENTGDEDLHISGFFPLLGGSTGGSGDLILRYKFNTVGGTILNPANEVTAVNKNAGSSKTLSCNCYYGFEGATVDSNLKTITSLSTGTGRNPLFVPIILPKGKSVTITVQPQSGNTSMQILAAIDCYIETEV